ncbi:unnamed protein product [Ixodes pacificus]
MRIIMLMMLMRWRNAKPCVLSGVRSRPLTRTFLLNPSMEKRSSSNCFYEPPVYQPCSVSLSRHEMFRCHLLLHADTLAMPL